MAKSNMCFMNPVITGAMLRCPWLERKQDICCTALVMVGNKEEGYGFCNTAYVDNNDKLPVDVSIALAAILDSINLPYHIHDEKLQG